MIKISNHNPKPTLTPSKTLQNYLQISGENQKPCCISLTLPLHFSLICRKMSTTARLISLLGGTSIFPPIQFTRKLLFSSSSTLRFHRHTFSSPYSSSSAAVTDSISTGNPETAVSSLHHPWPEWVSFVDRLNSKGYLSPSSLKDDGGESGDGNVAGADVVYKDMNLLKDACLSFARDRFDIFK